MKILITGQYEPNYNRTVIMIDGLKKLGHDIIERPIDIKTINIRGLNQLKKLSTTCDFTYFPPFTHKSLPKLRPYIHGPLVFDPLISKYNTNVFDYQLTSPFSFRAIKDWYRDWRALNLSDLVITDTETRQDYFSFHFGVRKSRMATVYIGDLLERLNPHPLNFKSGEFLVGFLGGFIPLQGTLNIIRAAKIIQEREPSIKFRLIGTGYQYEQAKQLINNLGILNIELPGWIKTSQINKEIDRFHLCLGIFGETPKTEMVIPNKIYHYIARNRPVLTKLTPAIKELFTPGKEIITCTSGPEDIAKNILEIKKNYQSAARVGTSCHEKMKHCLLETNIAQALVKQACQKLRCKNME
jgi:glycosyltransferase involved in cell wall biosynthesis